MNINIILGTIVQSINGPNLIISELIGNINIVQCAMAEFKTMRCDTSLKSFIQRLFSSKRYAFPDQRLITKHDYIRLGRKMTIANNHCVMIHLQKTRLSGFALYQTCWKNSVRFDTFDLNSTSKTCDACVLYKYRQETRCGFIRAIIYDLKNEYYVVIQKVNIDRYDTFIFKQRQVTNPFTFRGNLAEPPELMTIRLKDIIVKLAYSKQDTFHFHQYPNMVEST